MAEVTALFFAYAADRMSARKKQYEVRDGTTVAEFFEQELAGPLNEPVGAFLFSVNEEWADKSRVLVDGDALAVIPPVSGG
jgi:molybdopterin converting factor small subunit